MGFTRRDLLTFAGGSAAGLAFSPLPWGLLRDTALVSETWPGVPRPPHGEIRTRYSTCTLCPAGCGVRARLVGDRPVSLAGVPGNPASGGALCPMGLVGHHLAFCRNRATEPLANGKPVAMERALAGIAAAMGACGAHDTVAILDPRPGRAASLTYRRFLARLPHGIHCAPPDAQPLGPFGIDLENTRAIVSFGAPVLDGWLSPGRVLANRGHFQLVQVEAAYSRTASLADMWVPLLPGSEEAFAEAVAAEWRAEGSGSQDAPAAATARILMHNRPAIAVGSGAAAAKLNAILGGAGQSGGFLRRRDFMPVTDIATVPDQSIRVLLIEETSGSEPLPWDLLRRKLAARDSVVVALTPWLDGCAQHADYVMPAPVYLEALDEAPTPAGSTVAGFSLSPALLISPPQATSPADVILRLAHDAATYPDVLKQRVAAIKKDGRGIIFSYPDGKSERVSDIPSADKLWQAMLSGAIWLDDPIAQGRPESRQPATVPAPQAPTPEYPLILIAAEGPPPHASPLMSKLYRESGLRRPANAAALNPETGRNQSLADGCRAIVTGAGQTFEAQVIFDAAVMPGVIEMAGHGILPVNIRKA